MSLVTNLMIMDVQCVNVTGILVQCSDVERVQNTTTTQTLKETFVGHVSAFPVFSAQNFSADVWKEQLKIPTLMAVQPADVFLKEEETKTTGMSHEAVCEELSIRI